MQLAWGAHHDAITGSESDQVYLDLLTGWRDAWSWAGLHKVERCRCCRARCVLSFRRWWCEPFMHNRTDIVTVHLDQPVDGIVAVLDAAGAELPAVVEDGGHTVSWRAVDVGSWDGGPTELLTASPRQAGGRWTA